VTARYLPREVFFDRLGFAGAFFMIGASDLGRFLPATCDFLPIDVFPGHPTEVAPLAGGRLLPARSYALSVHARRCCHTGGMGYADRLAWGTIMVPPPPS
jgi:hypothetical protein